MDPKEVMKFLESQMVDRTTATFTAILLNSLMNPPKTNMVIDLTKRCDFRYTTAEGHSVTIQIEPVMDPLANISDNTVRMKVRFIS
jgi:hypothetical protein